MNELVFNDIVQETMQSVWERSPLEFQIDVCSHVLKMHCEPNNYEATLLVQGAGSGKSSVFQTIGVVDGGIILILETTLSLGADQSQKINCASNSYGQVMSFQLDSVKSAKNRNDLMQFLKSFNNNSQTTVFLFSSPEEIIKPCWCSCLLTLMARKSLKLIVIDEVHQFIDFGLTFRHSFCMLKKRLFEHVIDKKHVLNDPTSLPTVLRMPVLCMTATFNSHLVTMLEQMIGIRFLPKNFFWSYKDGMKKRHVEIDFKISFQPLRLIKNAIVETLTPHVSRKIIIYYNTASSVETMKDSIESWLVSDAGIVGDVMFTHGSLEPELKLAKTRCFTKKRQPLDNDEDCQFNMFPRILLATASCIGTGLDSDDVCSVIRIGCPPSRLELMQEMGRCGRNRNASSHPTPVDKFVIIANLDDFVHVHERMCNSEDSNTDENNTSTLVMCKRLRDEIISDDDLKQHQSKELHQVLKLFALHSSNCMHDVLESCVSSPMEPLSNINLDDKCGNACLCCKSSIRDMVLPVIKKGVQDFLVQTFISSNRTGPIHSKDIISSLQKFPDVGKAIYGRKKSNKPPDAKYVHMTILQLIASGMVTLCYDKSSSKATFSLGMCDSVQPMYVNDNAWNGINLMD